METKISVVGLKIRSRPDHQFDWQRERREASEETKPVPFIGPILVSLMYLLTAQLVWRTASTATIDHSETTLWRGISVALIALALNKLYGGVITDLLRMFAMEHGWYSQRRSVQVEFIAVVVAACLLTATAVLFLASHYPAATQIALIGTVMLLALGLVRDASLHQINDFVRPAIIWIVKGIGCLN